MLSPFLGDMMSFVKEYEPQLESAARPEDIAYSAGESQHTTVTPNYAKKNIYNAVLVLNF